MENQQITAEEQQRQERHAAAIKLLKVLETSPLDEALHFTVTLLAYMMLRCRMEPDGCDWNYFFRVLDLIGEDKMAALDAAPSPLVH